MFISAVVVCRVHYLYFDFIDMELIWSLSVLDVEERNIIEMISSDQLVQSCSNPFILHLF